MTDPSQGGEKLRGQPSTVAPGMRFGLLTAIAISGKSKDGHRVWECVCDCGAKCSRQSNALRARKTPSCGCDQKDATRRAAIIHGMHGTREYSSWVAMNARCGNPKHKDYPRYGARGILVHEEWQNSFQSFYAHIGPRPADTSIDRIDTRGNYVPGNVRWATNTEQSRNRTSSRRWIINGIRFESIDLAASEFGVSTQTIFRWTKGFFDPRRGTYTPPKEGCYAERI